MCPPLLILGPLLSLPTVTPATKLSVNLVSLQIFHVYLCITFFIPLGNPTREAWVSHFTDGNIKAQIDQVPISEWYNTWLYHLLPAWAGALT